MINKQIIKEVATAPKIVANQIHKTINAPKTDYTVEHRNMVVNIWYSGMYSTVSECAKAYNVKESTLYNWIHRAKKPTEATKTLEYNALKKELAKTKMELEI
jgi:transposase-like protein